MQPVTLIIDKRREISVKYRKLLKSNNNSVIITKNLLSALKIIQDKEPDLIIISDSIDSDLADFCKKIRALTYNMRPVIIATSKSAELSDKIAVLDSGADDFISEPVNPEEFLMRIKAHLRREFESNMNPKMCLPAKNYSLRALKRTLSEDTLWAVMYITIENFKNYKEAYTELASDKLVQTYCAIMNSVLSETDYLGTISDNEFLIITDRLKAEKIANFLTFAFDSVAPKFYSSQDTKRGFMIMRGDEIAGRRSNFVHTTIGIITNEFIQYKNSNQLIHALLHIHRMADMPDRSNYLMERPRITAENAVENEINNKIFIIEEDEATRLLLTTILELQGFDVSILQNISDINSIPAIMILDAGNSENFNGLEICKQLRENPDYNRTKLIVTSSIHDKELVLSSGADLYIPKPYEISSLIKWVQKLFRD